MLLRGKSRVTAIPTSRPAGCDRAVEARRIGGTGVGHGFQPVGRLRDDVHQFLPATSGHIRPPFHTVGLIGGGVEAHRRLPVGLRHALQLPRGIGAATGAEIIAIARVADLHRIHAEPIGSAAEAVGACPG